MADPQIVNTLRTKQAELQDAIAYLEGKLTEARTDLSHVNAVLRLYEVGPDPHLQFPAHVNLSRLFRRGEMMKLATAALGASQAPMNTRELAVYVVREKGWDEADKVLRSAVAYRLVQALTIAWKRGKIGCAGKVGGVRVWIS